MFISRVYQFTRKIGAIGPQGLMRVQAELDMGNLSLVHEEDPGMQFSCREVSEVAKVLVAWGCPELTESLSSVVFCCGPHQFRKLHNQLLVAVQYMQLFDDSNEVPKAQKSPVDRDATPAPPEPTPVPVPTNPESAMALLAAQKLIANKKDTIHPLH
ncbi:hypothetical protein FRC06_011639 [Ceratobasidium sp. 370]|nr:hypothetical protein FRC06_011639 [Ceratobasidium sp. 370]